MGLQEREVGADSRLQPEQGLASLSKHRVPAPMVPCFLQLLNLSVLSIFPIGCLFPLIPSTFSL